MDMETREDATVKHNGADEANIELAEEDGKGHEAEETATLPCVASAQLPPLKSFLYFLSVSLA
jgi:hypothetical protein